MILGALLIKDVHDGNTVMDYLPAERRRGITIQSAAITFSWRSHQINLIDTPGHADFTFEVERALRVLDGAVTILDAVAGVEAQTEKVWKQASTRNLARIVFINKMDRIGAAFGRTLFEIATTLRTRPLVLQVPIYASTSNEEEFIGVCDLLTMQCLEWRGSDGKNVDVTDLVSHKSAELVQEAVEARRMLVETLSELDDDIVEAFLEFEDPSKIPVDRLKRSIRHLCLSGQISPVLVGASFRNIGVQPLLDAVIDFLASPEDIPQPKALSLKKPPSSELTCALAFKVLHDPQKGSMIFVRVYAGTLTKGSILTNNHTKKKERVLKILRMYADDAREVDSVAAGDIAVILGLKNVRTGDTLTASSKAIDLQSISIPPSVFTVTLDTSTTTEAKALATALDNLLQEDPSLRVGYDPDTDQTLLSGMGELHLEIAINRLTEEYKVIVDVGKVRVGYRETVHSSTSVDEVYTFASSPTQSSTVGMKIVLGPCLPTSKGTLVDGNMYEITLPESQAAFSSDDALLAIRNGASIALCRGSILGYPLRNCHLHINVNDYDPSVTLAALSAAARTLTIKAVTQIGADGMSVQEPVMSVIVSTDEQHLGQVINDLTGLRGGHITSLDEEESDDIVEQSYYLPSTFTNKDAVTSSTRTIAAKVPLRQMIGYNSALRSITGGRGTFTMTLHDFESMNQHAVAQLRKL